MRVVRVVSQLGFIEVRGDKEGGREEGGRLSRNHPVRTPIHVANVSEALPLARLASLGPRSMISFHGCPLTIVFLSSPPSFMLATTLAALHVLSLCARHSTTARLGEAWSQLPSLTVTRSRPRCTGLAPPPHSRSFIAVRAHLRGRKRQNLPPCSHSRALPPHPRKLGLRPERRAMRPGDYLRSLRAEGGRREACLLASCSARAILRRRRAKACPPCGGLW